MIVNDPTYQQDLINAKPEWQLAWVIAQIVDDNAPLGWGKHIPLARNLLSNYDMKYKGP